MMRNLRRVVALATASGFFVGLVVARAPPPVAAATVSAPVVSTSESPSWALDAPDPDVVRDGDSYYAFTTGTTWGNHIGVLKSSSPVSGWNTVNGKSYGSSALPAPPGWQTTNTQTSPGVVSLGGRWVMYYDATVRATGKYCLSVATSSSPAQPFSDTTSGPWHCDDAFGGAIDPSPFVDADGRAWLYWKTNDGSDPQPARIWAAPLSADGLAFAATPAVVFTQDTVATPWETTVEDPDMIKVGGTYVLIFSANRWNSASYVQSDATCASPVGPCTQSTLPFLASYGSVAGPGGGTAFEAADGSWYLAYQGWTQGCTDYACGGARRLFVAPVQFGVLPTCTSHAEAAYVIAAADGSTTAFSNDGGACGRGLGVVPSFPVVGIASTPSTSGYWLVATDGGIFSFGDA
ncbi:MAG TPA: glycoside hydrolase family 43 protein, partial [Acidimicrobiia bacterium]|nr:glycoside hydrolase family 43 protein [Acidimicrobiia bacterium]